MESQYPASLTSVIKGLKKLNVNLVLGERVVEWPIDPEKLDGKVKKVVTDKGSVYEADLVVCVSDPLQRTELIIAPVYWSKGTLAVHGGALPGRGLPLVKANQSFAHHASLL